MAGQFKLMKLNFGKVGPLCKPEQGDYKNWAVHGFCITTCRVKDTTQVCSLSSWTMQFQYLSSISKFTDGQFLETD